MSFEQVVNTVDTTAVVTLVLAGVFFNLVSALGLVRLPDVYTRMQAATKGGTLGVGCIILGVAIHFQNLLTAAEAVLVIAFMFLTAPVAGHLIGRAAYFVRTPKCEHTWHDDLKACHDPRTHEIHAKPAVERERANDEAELITID